MKKLLLTVLTITMLSCGSDLDKKIDLADYKTIMESIQKNNKDYSTADYETAAREMNKYTFRAMSSGTTKVDLTYRDLLKQAKELNLQSKKELEAYNLELQKLKDVLIVKLTNGRYVDASAYSPQYPNGYAADVKVSNTNTKTIVAFEGVVLLFNSLEEQIMTYIIKENVTITGNKTLNGEDSTIIFEDDNLTELKALPFNKINQEWVPKTIIFEDGSRLDAPTKPIITTDIY